MSHDYMTVRGLTKNRVRVDPTKIQAVGGPAYPVLYVPAEVSLFRIEERDSLVPYSVVAARASLYVEGIPNKCADGICDLHPITVKDHDYEGMSFSFEFPLDYYRVEAIERARAGGDVGLRCDLAFQVRLYSYVTGPTPGPDGGIWVLTDFERPVVQMTFSIPHSHWVKKVLPGLGHGRIKLLEIPIPERLAPTAFLNTLGELEKAQGYFIKADYEKAVTHCRKSLEAVLKVLKPNLRGVDRPGFSTKMSKALEQHLAGQLSESKREALLKMLTGTWNLSSISTHHTGGTDYFDRADAEAMILHCSTILAYIGRAIRRKEKRSR